MHSRLSTKKVFSHKREHLKFKSILILRFLAGLSTFYTPRAVMVAAVSLGHSLHRS
jgi:hypothetical protein